MTGNLIDGYCYSFITEFGKERLFLPSFGVSRTRSKKNLNLQNNLRLEPVKPHKRYAVQVLVKEESIKEDHEEHIAVS